ncbi:MAG TPA: hypothetical protein VGM17_03945 [Rhizomicrobium sp.]
MRIMSLAALGAVAALGISAGSALAATADDASCHALDTKIGSVMDGSQAGNRDEAQKERSLGRQYCQRGFYKIGSDHLTAALKLLGDQSQQTAASD